MYIYTHMIYSAEHGGGIKLAMVNQLQSKLASFAETGLSYVATNCNTQRNTLQNTTKRPNVTFWHGIHACLICWDWVVPFIFAMTPSRVLWLLYVHHGSSMRVMTRPGVPWLIHVHHNAFMRVMKNVCQDSFMCAMTHAQVCRDSFMRGTTHAYVWHDSSMYTMMHSCVSWLIHKCNMSHYAHKRMNVALMNEST